MEKVKAWAKNLKRQTFVLYFAYKDDRVPWYAKIFIVSIVAYAFSPIDLIPDFIPVLGFLDEVIILPLGIMFALKMIPKDVIANSELKAKRLMDKEKPKNWIAGTLILFIWSMMILWMFKEGYQHLNEGSLIGHDFFIFHNPKVLRTTIGQNFGYFG